MQQKETIHWVAPEFEYHHKSASWYWLSAMGAAIIILLALIQRNFLFAIFIVIAELLVVRWGAEKPNYIEYSVDEEGIVVNGKKHTHYDHLSGFSFRKLHSADEGYSELLLKKKHSLGTNIRVIVPDQEIDRLKVFLNHRLHELDYEESLVDYISKILRF